MRSKINITANLYLLLGVLDIYGIYSGSDAFSHFAKPLLMPALIAFYLVWARRPLVTRDRLVVAALIFSWIGDLALMMAAGSPLFFLLGLVGFLIAHLFYIAAFTMVSDRAATPVLRQKLWLAIPIAAYLAVLLSIILPVLDTVMLVPVAIYALVIGTMVIFALNRYKRVSDSSFSLVFVGALLFMLSDSLIALDRFVIHGALPMSGIWIMALYILGQYCIVKGMLRNDNLNLT